MELLVNSLKTFFTEHGFDHIYWLAFSGGLDSRVLLELCAELRSELPIQLRAIHVNHGLSSLATKWSQHCETVCQQLQIDFHHDVVNAKHHSGDSPEEIAREKRYAIFAKLLAPNDFLLTAHQQNDQAETLLLQLFRGAGVKGLAAMPKMKPFAQGFHARPLLQYTRDELEQYATAKKLQWIDDESNINTVFTRNFLRHAIIPVLQTRWPTINKTLSRVAEHCAEANNLLEELAAEDLAVACSADLATLSVNQLQKLSVERQRLLLRTWIHKRGFPLPSAIKLQQIQQDFLSAREDKYPHIRWQAVELRRYEGKLYLMKCLPPHDVSQVFTWDTTQALIIPHLGELRAVNVSQMLTVRFRQGGEVCQLPGRKHHHELKKLMQQWQVPPWERNRIPLVYYGDKLIAVVGYFLAEEWQEVAFHWR